MQFDILSIHYQLFYDNFYSLQSQGEIHNLLNLILIINYPQVFGERNFGKLIDQPISY